jgi:hypothetical protein
MSKMQAAATVTASLAVHFVQALSARNPRISFALA